MTVLPVQSHSFIDVRSLIYSSSLTGTKCVKLLKDQGQNSPYFAELELEIRKHPSFFLCTSNVSFLGAWTKHKVVTQVKLHIREPQGHQINVRCFIQAEKCKA